MELKSLIQPENTRILTSRTKTEVLHELLDMAAESEYVTDVEGLKREIFYREQIMSTGIGQGIGIPHVRFSGISKPLILVGVSPKGIDDYDSLDGEPVRLVFMILVGEEQHREYLRILSLLVHRLKQADLRRRLTEAETDLVIFEILTGE